MFIICVYDSKSSSKFHKLCSKWLFWKQNSVFDWDLTVGTSKKFIRDMEKLLEKEGGSCVIYTYQKIEWIKTYLLGDQKDNNNFIF